MYWRCSLLILWSFLLATCAWTPIDTRDISTIDAIREQLKLEKSEEANDDSELPARVDNALMPGLPSIIGEGGSESRFDVFVNDVDARSFFMGLVKDTPYNMVVHPEVEGSISLDLRDVSIDEVMHVVNEVYGYSFKKRGRFYQILPGGLRSEIFQIDYLSLKRQGVSETQVRTGQITNSHEGSSDNGDSDTESQDSQTSSGVMGTRIQTTTEADFWGELKVSLDVLIGNGEGRRVVITPQAGVLVVRAFPAELDIVRDYLRRAELIMRRQVVLEAKVLEVSLNDSYQSGIDWTAFGTPGSDNSLAFSTSGSTPINPSNNGGLFGLAFDLGDFAGVISLLETQGSVQVLSSPRVSTINNQKAVIKVGQDEFFVTKIGNTTTTSTGSTVNNPTVQLTPFFSGIALDVTPQISEQDEIILHIHPAISDVQDQQKQITLGGFDIELPLALSTIRETDSIVFARSGQVVILGGLMQNLSQDENSGAPGAANIPFFGHLFTQQRNSATKSELVILLKPIIMGPDGLPESVDNTSNRFEKFRDSMEPSYFSRP